MHKQMIKSILLVIIMLFSFVGFSQQGWQWLQQFGDNSFSSSGLGEFAEDIGVDQWGNIYVSGYVVEHFQRDSSGNVLFDTLTFAPLLHNYGGKDVWIASYTPQGKLRWFKYAGSGYDDVYYNTVTDKLGNSYLTGSMNLNTLRPAHDFANQVIPNSEVGYFTAKLDSAGNQLWYQHMVGDTLSTGQYGRFPVGYGRVRIDIQNNVHNIIRGGSFGNGSYFVKLFGQDTIQNGIHDVIYSNNGQFIGSKSFNFDGSNNFQYTPHRPEVLLDANNNYYFNHDFGNAQIRTSTDTFTHNGFNNVLLMKYNSNSQNVWNHVTTNPFDQGYGTFVSGDTLFVSIHYTANGDTVQFDTINHVTDMGHQEGGLLLFQASTGKLLSFLPNKGKHLSSLFTSSAHANEHFMGIGGNFTHEMTFSNSTAYLNANNGAIGVTMRDNFVVVFDRQGNFITELTFKTYKGAKEGIGAMYFKDSSLYVAGSFQDTILIAGVDTLVSNGIQDIFVARYDINRLPVGIEDIKPTFYQADNGLLAYPNPTNENITLIGTAISNDANLFNARGQLVKTYKVNTNDFRQTIDLKEMPKGIYFLILQSGVEKQSLKIIKL